MLGTVGGVRRPARGASTESEPHSAGQGTQPDGQGGREAPLPWVPRGPGPDPAPAPGSPILGPPTPLAEAPAPLAEGRRPRSPAQRAISLAVVVALAALVGSGAVVFGPRFIPASPTTRLSPSPGSSTRSPRGSAQLLAAVAAADLPEIVTVVAVGSSSEELGTAWPIDGSGNFLTNDHVIHGGQSVHVLMASGQQYAAQVINDDPGLDLAEIHVWGLREQPLPIDDALPPIGEPVVVLAAEGATGHEPVTDSKVNGLNQTASVSDAGPGELSDYTGLIRIPARIYRGNSGGPMISPQGQVIGILTLAAQNGPGAFAIPIPQVDQVIQSWLNG